MIAGCWSEEVGRCSLGPKFGQKLFEQVELGEKVSHVAILEFEQVGIDINLLFESQLFPYV